MPPRALSAWRIALWAMLSVEALVLAGAAGWMSAFKACEPDREVGCVFSSHPVLLALLALVALGSLAGFFSRRGHVAFGFAALFSMRLLFESFASVFTVHHQTLYQLGAVLLGAVLGEAYAWALGVRGRRDERDWWLAKSYSATGALAVFAATYLCAATSKLRFGGVEWLWSSTIRLMTISHVEVGSSSLPDVLGRFVAGSPRVAVALELGTLVVQLSAILLVVPRLRAFAAAGVVAFHLGIWATSHILFVQPLLFALVVAFPWDRAARALGRDVDRDDAALASALAWEPERSTLARRRLGWLGALAVTFAVLGVIAPRATLASARDMGGFLATRPDDRPPPEEPARASGDVRALLGGLRDGEALGGWQVDAVRAPQNRRVTIELSRGEHRFRAIVARPDAVPFEPPLRTERYVLLYEPSQMPSAELAEERDRVLEALRVRLAANEADAGAPAGL